jgi:secondary thiamine-phosphate synthase enzyme
MYVETIELKTKPYEFYNLTEKVEKIVEKTEVKEGICLIFSLSTTSCILLQEDCPFLKEDLKKLLEKLAPKDAIYAHADNAHSHIYSTLFGNQKVIPIKNGKLVLGTWQEILFFEGDVKPRERKILVCVIGG